MMIYNVAHNIVILVYYLLQYIDDGRIYIVILSPRITSN